jgi:hypothetical protein
MMPSNNSPQLQDVLNAFSVEPKIDRETLERYLKRYPQYAEYLVDLSFELTRTTIEDGEPPSAQDEEDIENAWQRHRERISAKVTNPFTHLSIDNLRQIANSLDVPRSVVSAFRERKVIVDSVPKAFLIRFAGAVSQTVEGFVMFLRDGVSPASVRSYKSDVKPLEQKQVTFEQLLIQADMPQEKRETLLSEQ